MHIPFRIAASSLVFAAAVVPTAFAAPSNEALSSCVASMPAGTLEASADASLSSVAQSAPIAFAIRIRNTSSSTISHISIAGQVSAASSTRVRLASDNIATDLTLKAGESKTYSYVWRVPGDQQPGAYAFTPVVSIDGAQQHVPAHEFTVVGEDVGSVAIVDGIGVGGKALPAPDLTYYSAPGSTLELTLPVRNARSLDQMVAVTWRLYRGSAVVDMQTHVQLVRHGETAQDRFVPELPDDTGVYTVEAEASVGTAPIGATSWSFVRGKAGVPYVDSFGEASGGTRTLTACVRSELGAPIGAYTLSLRVQPEGLDTLTARLTGASLEREYTGALMRGGSALSLRVPWTIGEYRAAIEIRDAHGKLVGSDTISVTCAGACGRSSETIGVVLLILGVLGSVFTYRLRRISKNMHI